ncbi:P-loop containing nucleoside triphosphate hydrolase protein [Aspergillus campestris IBT 28561]|uniref:P-loop containing nucleoside triphosphate hydrolase protein n=1 Tax=Aspergillus campestris (strain IBT 28561) TaxID=1392248 RepID=A0A2I1CYZ5_ASPC2|nr:P-loop containing nucleoside triphosphate hydrolase protein [Aspergillus campestris IBT 28561]PKY02830.1 P-loop containing nucleoside triphosphate hydrolase protein [Aspergillus campestris IBT 28561]
MDHYEQLMNRIKTLEQENTLLRRFVDPDSTHHGPPFFQVLYRFEGNDRVFLRPPTWTRNASQGKIRYTLRGDPLSMKADEYLKRSRNLAFAIFKTYVFEPVDDPPKEHDQEPDMWPIPEPEAETIFFVSDYMREALDTYLDEQPKFKELFPRFDLEKEIPAPYLFWYCCRSSHDTILKGLSPRHRGLMELFAHWITSNYESEYTHVDNQISGGVISPASIKYLVKPGDVLVSSKKADFQAYMATSWAEQSKTAKKNNKGENCIEVQQTWHVVAWSYDYDGSFYRKSTVLDIEINVEDPTEEIALRDLSVFPMRYADQGTQLRLEQRGQTYWECRKKKFVSRRSSNDIESMTNNNERFMIDFPTYKQLHFSEPKIPRIVGKGEQISAERMDLDEPPPAPELFLFPTTIIGFNLRRKKWVNLEVDLIRKVEWNKQAFESLVVEEETKELVQALVTNRLEAERGTDMIDDKGNGLTILLHGGPGTGKTFTAESVAELAEKPLYRVTCGDIGTHPEEVEQYLESALHLGKIWGCVVLLDEADVFLQERTLSDLKRNALVTVFLRVLEYYDGILILTSNRVGTFDEAFKSRIQLSLHYPNLSQSQRLKVWRNLINRLKRLDQPSVDFDDVECYVAELAEKNMNGREIRNAITTARQLAKFKGKKVSHAHLKHVINVAGRFETYLSTLKEGFTDDDIARESGLR